MEVTAFTVIHSDSQQVTTGNIPAKAISEENYFTLFMSKLFQRFSSLLQYKEVFATPCP
jgi:hypothetical protein